MNLGDDKGFTGKGDKNSRVQLHDWWPDLVRQMLQSCRKKLFFFVMWPISGHEVLVSVFLKRRNLEGVSESVGPREERSP